MPRKPKQQHPLRQIREAIGKTQPEFAKMLGCSAPMVQAIENRQRQITVDMAEKVMEVTGAWPICLTENWDEAVDFNGDVYTATSFISFQHGHDEERILQHREQIEYALGDVLNAASKAGKSRLALYYLSKEIATIYQRLNLDDPLYSVFEKKSLRLSPPLTVRQLRQNPDMAKSLGFRDSPDLKDDDEFYSKLMPAHATEHSHHHTRWQTLDVEAPWFICQSPHEHLSEVEQRIFGSRTISAKYQNRQVEKHRAAIDKEQRGSKN